MAPPQMQTIEMSKSTPVSPKRPQRNKLQDLANIDVQAKAKEVKTPRKKRALNPLFANKMKVDSPKKINIFGSHNNIIDDNNDDPPKPRASQGRVSIQRGDTIQSQGTTIMHDYDEYDIANEHDLDRIHHLESIQDDSPIKPDGMNQD
eukprot:CAMPEP_0114660150 /NCGR_PEP_ID=MMETSP0191-20121206/19401_1 /TAXON_ID=126664 /ORGANISM="Sorites sp." /LENGTH=147 /DNA_ID=CAMNT_0001887767 /DNA_START=39 /DNA_END=483 /DNA_ORIENTATION=-